MRKQFDLRGQAFGRLTAIEPMGRGADGRAMWRCQCSCGVERVTRALSLKSGGTRSCGCLQRESAGRVGASTATHGHRYGGEGGNPSKEYAAWLNAKARCFNPNYIHFKHYGGRGISVCPEWSASFERFLADVGPCPPRMSLDRIDVNGNYEPGNVRWASNKTQGRNKRNNRILLVDGVPMVVVDAARYLGVNDTSVMRALRGSVLSAKNRERLKGHSIMEQSFTS